MIHARSGISEPSAAVGCASGARRPCAPWATRRPSTPSAFCFDADEDDTAPHWLCDFLRPRFVEPEPTCLPDLLVAAEESLVDRHPTLLQLLAFERPDDDVLDAGACRIKGRAAVTRLTTWRKAMPLSSTSSRSVAPQAARKTSRPPAAVCTRS